MQILSTFMKVAKKRLPAIMTYVIIFVTIMLLMSNLAEPIAGSFETTHLDVVILDEDNSPESAALTEYIGKLHNIVALPDYDVETLQDNLYYQQIDYVLTINSGYGEKLSAGETDGLFKNATDPQSYTVEYISTQLEQYVRNVKMYIDGGFTADEAIAKVAENADSSVDVTISDEKTETGTVDRMVYSYFLYLAYIVPGVLISCLTPVIITLNKKEVCNRTICSPLKQSRISLQISLGTVILCLALWALLVVIAFIQCGSALLTANALYILLNSFLFLLVSAGIAAAVSSFFTNNTFIIDMISNVVVLGMSFLCGVFVPQSLLGDSVLAVSKFLPAYWYVRAIDMLGGMNGAVYDENEMWLCFGIQFLFAIALFAVAFLAGRVRKKQTA